MPDNNNPIKQKILKIAEQLYLEIGERFTMDQLEARTGVSRTTIYRIVGSKTAILQKLAGQRGELYTKADLKYHILLAARTVFGRAGLSNATLDQIAAEAGLGIATIYRCFGDKERLIKAFIAEIAPREVLRERALKPSENIAADLEQMVTAALAFFIEYRDIIRLALMGNEAERQYFKTFQKRSDSTLDRLASYFQYQLDLGRLYSSCSAHELALGLMGMVISFVQLGPLSRVTAPEPPGDMSKKIVELFLGDLREKSK